MATRLQTGWPAEVAHMLGIPKLDFGEAASGRVVIHLDCTTCGRTIDFESARRLPPEALKKKLQQKGWDTKPGKNRCPTCKTNNRRTPVHREKELPPPPPPTLDQQIEAVFTKKEEVPMAAHRARLAVDKNNIRLVIPKDSNLLPHFIDENKKSRSYWKMTIISPGINLPPQVMIERLAEKPKDAVATVKGHYSDTGGFHLQISKSFLPAGMKKYGTFSSDESEVVSESDDRMVFALPETAKLKSDEPTPILQTQAEPAASQPVVPAKVEQVQVVEPEKRTITLEQAISAINKFKQRNANLKLVLTEEGLLGAEETVIRKFGALNGQ